MNQPIEEAYQIGDQVKLIFDKETGPDNHLHGKTGEIIDVGFDDAESVTGNTEDNFLDTVKLENGDVPDIHFHYQAGAVLAHEDYDLLTEYWGTRDIRLEDLDTESEAIDTLIEEGAVDSISKLDLD